ncbi:hypothetical protein ASG22_07175 [Chryseobacterium sp. Leaf405]|nr:hypothetical protein ASG22_07175 [Chryseobacterium sp. Leaf405]
MNQKSNFVNLNFIYRNIFYAERNLTLQLRKEISIVLHNIKPLCFYRTVFCNDQKCNTIHCKTVLLLNQELLTCFKIKTI